MLVYACDTTLCHTRFVQNAFPGSAQQHVAFGKVAHSLVRAAKSIP